MTMSALPDAVDVDAAFTALLIRYAMATWLLVILVTAAAGRNEERACKWLTAG